MLVLRYCIVGPFELIDDGELGSAPPAKHLQTALLVGPPAHLPGGDGGEGVGGVLRRGLEGRELEGAGGLLLGRSGRGGIGTPPGDHASF